EESYQVETATTFVRACSLIKNRSYDVAVLDLQLHAPQEPDNRDGVFLLRWLMRKQVPVVIVTAVPARRLVDEILSSYGHVYEIVDKSDSEAIAGLAACVEKARQSSFPSVADDPARFREVDERFERLIAGEIERSRTGWEANHLRELASHDQASQATVTWLHISDLHLSDDKTLRSSTELDSLLVDIERQIGQHKLVPDWAAVTGDIAFSGQEKQYARAAGFFDRLLDRTGLTKERLLVVPGNHDVSRSLVSTGARILGDSLHDGKTISEILSDDGDRRFLLKRFEGYARFVGDYFEGHSNLDSDRYFYVRKFELADRQIAVLGLNSAWVSASDRDEANRLLVGEEQVRAALGLAAEADIRIALLHHPFRELRECEQQTVERLLCQECQFVLHGHGHRTDLTLHRSPDASAMVIAGGASHAGLEYSNTYNLVQFNPGSGQGHIVLRRWSGEGVGFWAEDNLTYRNVKNGIYQFTL
ncbi:MAG: response regulator, partial [Chloroflexi bacterium]